MAGAAFTVTDPGAIRRVADPGIGDIARRVRDDAAARSPVQTGRLQSSWQVVEHEPGMRQVINTAPYARFVEYGTKYDAAQPMLGPAVAHARSGP
jgi:HK97 gp10 family phage protein